MTKGQEDKELSAIKRNLLFWVVVAILYFGWVLPTLSDNPNLKEFYGSVLNSGCDQKETIKTRPPWLLKAPKLSR